MNTPLRAPSFTTFNGHRRIASGPLSVNVLALKKALRDGGAGPVLIFDDASGKSIDVDTSGTDEETVGRLAPEPPGPTAAGPGETRHESGSLLRGRGRPKLGVISREVTLLPRHWEWLAGQPGGASVALRKLVEDARRTYSERDRHRRAQERTYHFMLAVAGDLPGFEEATRALFAKDAQKLRALIHGWPEDVRDHALWLANNSNDVESCESTAPVVMPAN